MLKYKVMDSEDAYNLLGIKCNYDYDCRSALVEFKDEVAIRIVAEDGGQPEDQLFTRDWSWVEFEMNKLAEEISRLLYGLEAGYDCCGCPASKDTLDGKPIDEIGVFKE